MADREVVIRIRAENLTRAEFDKARKQIDDLGKKAGFTGRSFSQMERGVNRAATGLARFNPVASRGVSVLGGFGALGIAAGAGLGVAALGFSKLTQESERLTKEADKLKISTDDYQKSLGVTIPLSKDAIEAGIRLGKSWDDLSASATNLALNALTDLADALSAVSQGFLSAANAREVFDSGSISSGSTPFGVGKGVGSLPGLIDPNTAAALARAGITVGSAPVGPFRLGGNKPSADVNTVGLAPWTEEDWLSWKRQTDELATSTGKAAKSVGDLSKSHERAIADMQSAALRAFDPSGFFTPLSVRRSEGSISIPSPFSGLPGAPINEFGVIPPSFGIPDGAFDNVAGGLDVATDSLDSFGLSLEAASQISLVFGDQLGVFGDALVQGSSAADLMKEGLDEGGLSGALNLATGAAIGFASVLNATGTGSQGSRAASGALAGASAGAAFGPIGLAAGAGIGALVGFLRGQGPADIGRDAGRDIGVELSQALKEEIDKSKEPIQTFLTEIFAEGNLSIDRFAEEVGDLFSMLQRGELSKETVFAELQEDLPILIEHFEELGPAGEENIRRIQLAAQDMGFDLGLAGDQLDRLLKGIPELTLEGFQQKFDLNAEQTAGLQGLGLNLQTDVQRIADDLNVPLNILEGFVPALEEIGISATELPDFLEAANLSVQDLFEKLGVPPELQASWEEFTASLGPEALPEGVTDPTMGAEATGAAVANHLLPGFDSLGDRIDGSLSRFADVIARAVQNAVAQGT